MKNYLFLFLMFLSSSIMGCKKDSTVAVEENTDDWQLIWSDEFNYSGHPDSQKWSHEVGGHGWGNNELQYYTDKRLENARVEDSVLVIEARKESYNGSNFTSARLVTTNKGDWTYGRFEIKAMLPFGLGTWPALWMLATDWTYGDGGWPDNGEIDIMEHVGFDPGWVHGSVHTRKYYHKIGTQKSSKIFVKDVTAAFHVYALEWTPEQIDVFIDSKKYFTFKNEGTGWEVWPFDKNFHFIFNIAVGGDWGGAQGVDETIFPQKMLVDYVRVYKKKE